MSRFQSFHRRRVGSFVSGLQCRQRTMRANKYTDTKQRLCFDACTYMNTHLRAYFCGSVFSFSPMFSCSLLRSIFLISEHSFPSLSLPLYFSLSFSHVLMFSLSPSHFLFHSHFLSRSLSLSLSLSTHTLSISIKLSLYLTHTLTHSHTHGHNANAMFDAWQKWARTTCTCMPTFCLDHVVRSSLFLPCFLVPCFAQLFLSSEHSFSPHTLSFSVLFTIYGSPVWKVFVRCHGSCGACHYCHNCP